MQEQTQDRNLQRLLNGDKAVAAYIISNAMGETDSTAMMNRSGTDATPLELVNESLIVIGPHASPAPVTNLTVEDVY